MKAKSFDGMTCSIAAALEAVGDRWAFLILRDLSLGVSRYDELRASTGMPTTTLAGRLKHLESSGLVERRPYQDNPPRADYVLTPRGHDLWKVLIALREWGDRWVASARGGPPVELVDRESGRPLSLALVDAETGEIAVRRRAVARAGPGADETVRFRLAGGRPGKEPRP